MFVQSDVVEVAVALDLYRGLTQTSVIVGFARRATPNGISKD